MPPFDFQKIVTDAKARVKEIDETISPLETERFALVAILESLGERDEPSGNAPEPVVNTAAEKPEPSRVGRGRPKGRDTRAAQAIELIRHAPGITIPEMAKSMGIQQNYLYRVLPGLADQGKIYKENRGWFLAPANPPTN